MPKRRPNVEGHSYSKILVRFLDDVLESVDGYILQHNTDNPLSPTNRSELIAQLVQEGLTARGYGGRRALRFNQLAKEQREARKEHLAAVKQKKQSEN